MRILVFFDLPVGTREERKAATSFRKWLLDEGYYMMQFSVYGRLCGSIESVDTHISRVEAVAPTSGSVRVLAITEKQYASIKILVGKKKISEKTPYQTNFTYYDEDFQEN